MALPKINSPHTFEATAKDGSVRKFDVNTSKTPFFIQKMIDPSFGGQIKPTFGQKFLSGAYRATVAGALHAAGGGDVDPLSDSSASKKDRTTATIAEAKTDKEAAGNVALVQALAPLNTIANHLSSIAVGVASILGILKQSNQDGTVAKQAELAPSDQRHSELTNDNAVNDNVAGSDKTPPEASAALGNRLAERETKINAANDNEIVVPEERRMAVNGNRPMSMFDRMVDRTVGPIIRPPASEPGDTIDYQQHERQEQTENAFEIKSFGDHAMKQLGDLIENAMKAGEHKEGLSSIIPAAAGGLMSMFKKKSKIGGKLKAAVEESKVLKGKLPADKVERAAAQVRGPDGRFVKTAVAGAAAEEGAATSGISKVGSALGKVASKAGGLLKVGGKALGLAAVPLAAGLDYFDRKDKGQTNMQAGVGAAGGVAGMLAGGAAGAEGGALIGGGIGAMFGGVGAAPGAAIGGVVGGVGGAIAGSGVGGWIADKFTGANKPVAKDMGPTPQTRDIMSLEKSASKKQAEAVGGGGGTPAIISAPSSKTTVVNHNNNTLAGTGSGGGSRGPRGSLDLSKY